MATGDVTNWKATARTCVCGNPETFPTQTRYGVRHDCRLCGRTAWGDQPFRPDGRNTTARALADARMACDSAEKEPETVLESYIEQSSVAWAEENGFLARKMKYIGRRGCPDYLFVGYGHCVLMEFKAPGETPEPHQVREHMRFEERGVTVHVVDSVERAKEILRFVMQNDRSPLTFG